jgi:hypothetical protein
MLQDPELSRPPSNRKERERHGFEPDSIKITAVHNGTVDRDRLV